MNICCQNGVYVGRTNLSKDDTVHKLLQGEIDTLTLNLDTTNSNLETTNSNLAITNSNLEATNIFVDEINSNMVNNLNPLTYLINTEFVEGTIIPPVPDRIHTYIYNSNIIGEIRFWVASSSNYPPVFPQDNLDYRVKIDVDGKLKLYYTYDPAINASWFTNWFEPANVIVGLAADSVNQGLALGGLQTEFLANKTFTDGNINTIFAALQAIETELGLLNGQINSTSIADYQNIADTNYANLQQQLNNLTTDLTQDLSQQAARGTTGQLFGLIRGSIEAGRNAYFSRVGQSLGDLILANPATAFMTGVGGAAMAAVYGILQNASAGDILNKELFNAYWTNSNLTSNDRRILIEEVQNNYITSNIFDTVVLNYQLNQAQGFISSNILTSQSIPIISGSRIGLGITPSTNYELDVVGKINSDYYYRSGVQQFMGNSLEYSNLSRSQGFINSNVLTAQTIPQIYASSKVGIATAPSATHQLDVNGTINATNYYKAGTLQFMGTELQYSNLSRSQGFINSNVLTAQTIPQISGSRIGLGIAPSSSYELDVVGKINSDYYYRGGVQQFIGTALENSNLSRSQGFINSNVLTAQTIPQISGSRIGLGIAPSTSYELDVNGKINATNYYKAGVLQYSGIETDYSNLARMQGFINSNVLTPQTIPQISGSRIGIATQPSATHQLDVNGTINATNYYKAGTLLFTGTELQYSNLSRSQCFINSNVLSVQTIPRLSVPDKLGIGISDPLTNLEIHQVAYYNRPLVILDVGPENAADGILPRQIGNPMLRLGFNSYSSNAGDYFGIGLGHAPLDYSHSFCEIGAISTDHSAYYKKGDLVFSTRNTNTDVPATERMRITSDGRVGIGTAPYPGFTLRVEGTTYSTMYRGNQILLDNNLGVNVSIARAAIDVAGPVNIRGNSTTVASGVNNYFGCLTIGAEDVNYGGQITGYTNKMGLLLECWDTTEISISDTGNRLVSFMYYQQNQLMFGRDIMGNGDYAKAYFRGDLRVDGYTHLYNRLDTHSSGIDMGYGNLINCPNVGKRIYYSGAPILGYFSGGYYRVDINPSLVMAEGEGNVRYFRVCYYSDMFNLSTANFPVGVCDVLIDYSTASPYTTIFKPIYLGTGQGLTYSSGSSFTIYFSLSSSIVVNIYPINVYN